MAPPDVAEIERDYFDGLIEAEGGFDPFLPTGWNTLRRCFGELVGEVPVDLLLEVGCGTGSAHPVYAGRFERRVAIDLSGAALRHAQARFPGDDHLRTDACLLPFAKASVDTVAFSSVLHHIPEFALALREARRVLRPGGAVFAFDPNLLHPAMALFRHPKSPLYRAEGVSPNERPLTPGELRRAFEDAGLGPVMQHAQAGIPYRKVAPGGLNAVLRVYNALDRAMHLSGAGRVFGSFVVTAGRRPAEP